MKIRIIIQIFILIFGISKKTTILLLCDFSATKIALFVENPMFFQSKKNENS